MAILANIGPRERRKRLILGLTGLATGVAIVASLVWTDATRWWRLVAFLPFWVGALGIFQATAGT